MTRQFRLLACITCILASPFAFTAQYTDQQPNTSAMRAIDAAFLQDQGLQPTLKSGQSSVVQPYFSCAAVFSRMPDGTPELIAAAYSGKSDEVAMLSYRSSEARIVNAVNDRQLGFDGGSCEATVVNLADPEQSSSLLARTVEISFGGQDWFFLWDSGALRSITAVDPRTGLAQNGVLPDSYMHTTEVVDVDHSGAMQVVGNNGDSDKFPQDDGIASTGTDILFRYNGTTYAPAKTFLYLERYEPDLPKSQDEQAAYQSGASPWTQELCMHQTPAPNYQLRVINGDRDGRNRVTSAKVEVNGVLIVPSADVNQDVEILTRTIQLGKKNEIRVTADGPVNSHLYVTIE